LEVEINITELIIQGPKPRPRTQFASVTYKDRYLIVLGGESYGKKTKSKAEHLSKEIDGEQEAVKEPHE
jgi:hypothetical protein